MKTADLIPLILIELADGNKYGFELTKAIEDKSNQQIQIKQPTLYTVLKKLEKSKFISSYWEDSEIGGKRHYYKITENGKAQIATLPSFEQCIQNILIEEQENETNDNTSAPISQIETQNQIITEQQPHVQQYQSNLERFNASFNDSDNTETDIKVQNQEVDFNLNQPVEATNQLENPIQQQKQTKPAKDDDKFVSIMDLIADNATTNEQPTNIQPSIINPTELFESDNIDHKTELEINKSNSTLLKNQTSQQAEQFAENKQISKFVEKVPAAQPATQDIKSLENKSTELKQKQTNTDYAYDNIKYVDYVDFKTKKEYIYAKKIAKLSLLKTFAVSIYALIMLIVCAVCVKGHASVFYYCFFIISIIYTLCYLAAGIKTNENLRLKSQQHEYKPNFKFRLIFDGIITLIMIVLSIISSVLVGNNTISSMFGGINFANIYAPILLCTIIWLDTLLTYIVTKLTKIDKSNKSI